MDEFLKNIGVGIRPINDTFFEQSYNACKIFQRKGITVEDNEELCHEVIREFPCYVSSCKAIFQTLIDFEMHYNSNHRYACAECKKSLPNPRLLDIHIQESHDSFFKVLSIKKPMYQCYVSDCNLKFNDASERRNHCINVHKFSKNFKFDNTTQSVKNEPKDKMDIDEPEKESKQKKIQLNKGQKIKMFNAATKSASSKDIVVRECNLNTLNSTSGVSSLVFIPRQVQKSYTKALTNNQTNEQNVLETGFMMDLVESLPNI